MRGSSSFKNSTQAFRFAASTSADVPLNSVGCSIAATALLSLATTCRGTRHRSVLRGLPSAGTPQACSRQGLCRSLSAVHRPYIAECERYKSGKRHWQCVLCAGWQPGSQSATYLEIILGHDPRKTFWCSFALLSSSNSCCTLEIVKTGQNAYRYGVA